MSKIFSKNGIKKKSQNYIQKKLVRMKSLNILLEI